MNNKVLLIEDDAKHCQEYVDYNNEQCTPYFLRIAYGCSEGLSLLESFQPDFILLDLMLNESDGSGIEFLAKFKNLTLLKQPHIITITSILSKITHENVLKLGADFIITKDKFDYSPKFAFDYISNIPSDENYKKCRYNSEEMIKTRITEMIENIGITHGIDGRAYVIEAIFYSINLKTNNLSHIYSEISKKYGKSNQSIDKAIRTAIKRAWRNTDINILNKYYTPQTSFINNAPSNKEFICFFVDKLKA